MNIDLLIVIGVPAVFVAAVLLFCYLRPPPDDYVGTGCNAP
jgi:hypothetical protein